ncbi:hypothetical protein, partial [Paraburkholderia sp. XV]|uniref:hypothetical protein n=1 Tax=Paraburkholderia sp. XV TaxID=2831520 RepID=UPI001CD276BF
MKHCICLADAGRCAEKNLQLATLAFFFFALEFVEEFVGVGAGHGVGFGGFALPCGYGDMVFLFFVCDARGDWIGFGAGIRDLFRGFCVFAGIRDSLACFTRRPCAGRHLLFFA